MAVLYGDNYLDNRNDKKLKRQAMNNYLSSVDDKDKMTEEQRTSFNNEFQMIKLPVETELWRFVSTKTTNNLGAFWMKPETMKILMRG